MDNMNRISNQDIERHYFEMFRYDYPLPPGTVTYGDRPDIIIEGERRVGIEVTNFFFEEGSLPKSDQAQRKLREKVVSEAQQVYQAGGGRKIAISFGFDKANPIRDQKSLVGKLVEIAKRIEKCETGQIVSDTFRTIQELSFVYLNAKENENATWRLVQVYNVPIMSRDRLLQIVRGKEVRANSYRKCDVYWLLVVVDFINSAQDQEIQSDGFEKIKTETFEKVIVYKTLFGHILEAK